MLVIRVLDEMPSYFPKSSITRSTYFKTLLLQTYFFIRSETQSQKGMTSQQISDGFWDKVQAHLRDDAQNRADEQKAL